LASLTRETGPKVVRGDPARKGEVAVKAAPVVAAPPKPHHHHHHHVAPTISVSDSSLKFTHVLYNLSPAGTQTCHVKFVQMYAFSMPFVLNF
jgi:phosphoenolpyruvate carboxykinase (ATP)